jgi:hypothetical protein
VSRKEGDILSIKEFILMAIILISMILCIPILKDYFECKENPISFWKKYYIEVKTIGDILFGVCLILPWLFSSITYLIIILFYNRYTIKLMNIKIR